MFEKQMFRNDLETKFPKILINFAGKACRELHFSKIQLSEGVFLLRFLKVVFVEMFYRIPLIDSFHCFKAFTEVTNKP